MNKPDQNSKPAFSGERIALGEYVTAAKRRNTNAKCTAVYSVTNSYGFTPSEAYFSKEVYSKELKTYKVVERNMIAFNPSRINVGSVALQDKADEVIVSPLYVVFSVDERRLLPEYVVRFLKSKPGLRQIAARSIGTVRNNLKYDALCRMEMNLPSLEDQQTQLAALSLVEKQISAQKAMISHLQSLAKSRFVEMFGDGRCFQKCKIGDLVCGIVSGTNVSGKQRPLGPDEFGVLKISSVTKGVFDSSEFKVVSDPNSVRKMIYPRKGDLLFSRANTSEMIGATAIVDNDYDQLFLPDKLWRLDPSRNVDTIFLKQLLSSKQMRATLSKISTGTSGSMQNISMSKFRSVDAYLPPLPLQREFAAFAGRAAKLEFVAQQQIEKLQTLYDSLAQEYFG